MRAVRDGRVQTPVIWGASGGSIDGSSSSGSTVGPIEKDREDCSLDSCRNHLKLWSCHFFQMTIDVKREEKKRGKKRKGQKTEKKIQQKHILKNLARLLLDVKPSYLTHLPPIAWPAWLTLAGIPMPNGRGRGRCNIFALREVSPDSEIRDWWTGRRMRTASLRSAKGHKRVIY